MRILFSIIFLMSYALAFGQDAQLILKEKSVKFPKSLQGKKLEKDFIFTNTGDAPLIISRAKVSCKCTKVTFPEEPVAPNGEGVIQLIFDTKSAFGYQNREILIYSNAKGSPHKIRLKADIKKSGF